MVKRHNNQLPDNLPQLQNLIKRDPISYKEEFLQQQLHYQSLMKVFQLRPDQPTKQLDDLVMFMAQVAHCYPDQLVNFAQELISLLQTHSTVLDPAMRMTFCRALILLRNKNLLSPTDLLSLFFQLLKCQDKNLRRFLEAHIVTDIKNINSRHKNARLNTTLQNFMYSMLKENNVKAAKMSVNIMIKLYKKNVWNDAKTVNVIAAACFSKITKVMVTALNFFIGSDPADEKKSDDDDSDDEPNPREVMMANKVNKKTRKRDKQLKKVKQLAQKVKKDKSNSPSYNFSALHLIHDPQGLAERLFRQLESSHERFQVRLMTLDMISRLIGLHQLVLLNFYPYIQRFLQPHQKEVVRLLQFVAQSSHELVPPDVLEPVLKSLVNNFVTERNTSDCMAIGLNAIRELCSRCPFVMTAELLRDLAEYKNYREKSVAMAAKSLINYYRTSMPELLHKRDRGKPTEASLEIKTKKFGEIEAKDYIPGAEVLLEENKSNSGDSDDGSDNDDEWIDVSHSSDDENDQDDNLEEEDDKDCNDSVDNEKEMDSKTDDDKNENQLDKTIDNSNIEVLNESTNNDTSNKNQKNEAIIAKKQQAALLSVDRIFTDEDFNRIDAALIRKQMQSMKRGTKRPHPDEISSNKSKSELVSLADIEMIHKKRKHDKQQRIESIRKGQEGREKFGYKDGRVDPFSSKTNREKRKNKNFMMVKHKVRSKIKRSFKDKQVALRNYLLKQKRMK